jgi:hypothetical protein
MHYSTIWEQPVWEFYLILIFRSVISKKKYIVRFVA